MERPGISRSFWFTANSPLLALTCPSVRCRTFIPSVGGCSPTCPVFIRHFLDWDVESAARLSEHNSTGEGRFHNPLPPAHGRGLSCTPVTALGLPVDRETPAPSSHCCRVGPYAKALCRVPIIGRAPDKQAFPILLCKRFVSLSGSFPTAWRDSVSS